MERRWMTVEFVGHYIYTPVWFMWATCRRYPQSYPQRGLSPRQRCGIFISADLGGEADDLEGCGSSSSLTTPEKRLPACSRRSRNGRITLHAPPRRYSLAVRLTELMRGRGGISRGMGGQQQMAPPPSRDGNRIVRSSGKTWTAGKAPTVTCLVRSGMNED